MMVTVGRVQVASAVPVWRAVGLVTLATLCIAAVCHPLPLEAVDSCSPNSKEAVSRTGTFCLCEPGFACQGAACKTGHLRTRTVQGFPLECITCSCVGEVEQREPSVTRSSVAHKENAQPFSKAHTTTVVPEPAENISKDGLKWKSTTTINLKKHEEMPNIIFIKAFKVASTTVSAIFQRLQEEKHLKVANRYNSVQINSDARFNLIYGHNFYDMGTSPGNNIVGCDVHHRDDDSWTYCGGYQPWMDEYVPDAIHLVMVAEPLQRVASMYYYETSYTKLRDRLPGDRNYRRLNEDARFEDPRGEDNKFILKWLDNGLTSKWERVQWWWLREGTPGRSLQETVDLVQTVFFVGLRHKFDQSLLMWRRTLGLGVRDIIYTSVKAQLSHPKFEDWSPEVQQIARDLVQATGDLTYYEAVQQKFRQQVEAYGADALEEDTAKFTRLLARLQRECRDTFVASETLHVPDQVFCLLRAYDSAYSRLMETTEYMGCYQDLNPAEGTAGNRYALKMMSRRLTLAACWRRCQRDHLPFVALYFADNCYCGEYPPSATAKVTEDGHCNKPCAGEPSRMCGGGAYYSVYRELPRDSAADEPIIEIPEDMEL